MYSGRTESTLSREAEKQRSREAEKQRSREAEKFAAPAQACQVPCRETPCSEFFTSGHSCARRGSGEKMRYALSHGFSIRQIIMIDKGKFALHPYAENDRRRHIIEIKIPQLLRFDHTVEMRTSFIV